MGRNLILKSLVKTGALNPTSYTSFWGFCKGWGFPIPLKSGSFFNFHGSSLPAFSPLAVRGCTQGNIFHLLSIWLQRRGSMLPENECAHIFSQSCLFLWLASRVTVLPCQPPPLLSLWHAHADTHAHSRALFPLSFPLSLPCLTGFQCRAKNTNQNKARRTFLTSPGAARCSRLSQLSRHLSCSLIDNEPQWRGCYRVCVCVCVCWQREGVQLAFYDSFHSWKACLFMRTIKPGRQEETHKWGWILINGSFMELDSADIFKYRHDQWLMSNKQEVFLLPYNSPAPFVRTFWL